MRKPGPQTSGSRVLGELRSDEPSHSSHPLCRITLPDSLHSSCLKLMLFVNMLISALPCYSVNSKSVGMQSFWFTVTASSPSILLKNKIHLSK